MVNSNSQDGRPVKYQLRLPANVKEKLEARAKQAHRSLHGELLSRLENSLKAEEMLEQGAAQ